MSCNINQSEKYELNSLRSKTLAGVCQQANTIHVFCALHGGGHVIILNGYKLFYFKLIFLFYRFMIQCDKQVCFDWYHGPCIGISRKKAEKMDKFVCFN
jgi:hypothetical protein